MNQRGQLIQIFAFITAVLLAWLFITIGEPIIDAMLDIIPGIAGDGSSIRLIIFGATILILLGGIWFLTRKNEEVAWNG